jgi:hypothetical protein
LCSATIALETAASIVCGSARSVWELAMAKLLSVLPLRRTTCKRRKIEYPQADAAPFTIPPIEPGSVPMPEVGFAE